MEEIEVKFLDINPEVIIKKLESIGGTRVFERLYRRTVFDYPDWRLDAIGAWVRLRDEGDKITLTYKQRLGIKPSGNFGTDEGMEEIEVTVDSYDKMALLLQKIGFTIKGYQENRRIRYLCHGIEYDIDFWPNIPPYLEIEADSWEKIGEGMRALELDPQKKLITSTTQIYTHYGITLKDYTEVTFDRMVKK